MAHSADNNDQMNTLTACLEMLDKLGFSVQFKAVPEGLKSIATKQVYKPQEIKIVNFYRFEGESDPDDNAILYAISTTAGEKGTLIDIYGSNNDPLVSDFIRAVDDIHKKVDKEEKM
jgi:hypothetical protein